MDTKITEIPLGRAEDLIGRRFESLVVVSRAPAPKNLKSNSRTFYNVKCDCGNYAVVRRDSLHSKNTTSCGCMRGNPIDELGNQFGSLKVIGKGNGPVHNAY